MTNNDNDTLTHSEELQEHLEPIPSDNKQVEYFNPHTAHIKQEVILIGSDHRGFDLKLLIREHLVKRHYDVLDVGTHNKDRCDYPNVAKQLCKTMNSKKGILICGSGFGMSITANRHTGVHAVVPRSVEECKIARQHGNVNMLCIGSDFTTNDVAIQIVNTFLNTPFEELSTSRYSQRIRMIDE
ncbi:MAG: RpiB/LacA/LacB family sugar-phosphate isomerase [Proteobacteria bacterium]|nr:RpiB/LacA/LacB family sugar-phosphate isomerase [Pseudomonadota bacterium]